MNLRCTASCGKYRQPTSSAMLVRESRTNSAAPVIAVVATMAALSAHVTTAVVSERAYVQGPAVSWLDHFPQRCIWRTCVGSREAAVGAFGATV